MERAWQSGRKHEAPRVMIRASAPCEFIMHMSECSSPGWVANLTLGKAWFTAIRKSAAPDLMAALDTYSDPGPSPQVNLWSKLLALAYETPEPHDVPTFLSHFAATPPLQVRLFLLGYHDFPQHRRAPQETLLQAAQGEEVAVREVAERHFPTDAHRRQALLELLSMEPEETRSHLLVIMERWYQEVFRDQEKQIMPILERDARATRELRSTLTLDKLVETLTNGLEFHPWPGLQWVALVPTYVARPWTVEQFEGEGIIICYPASDESLEEGDGPPARLIRLHQALGDERRLRILRHVAQERSTFQEIATALDLPKSSLHYHLSILRSAGLLRASSGEHGVTYGLRREVLTGMGEALLRYLEADSNP